MLVFATLDVNRTARDCPHRRAVAEEAPVLAFERAAHAAARRAGALIRARYGERQQVSFKSEVDLVTAVDREAERLNSRFPGRATGIAASSAVSGSG